MNEIDMKQRTKQFALGIPQNSRRLKMKLSQTHKSKFKNQKPEML